MRLPLTVRVRYWSEPWQAFWNLFWAALLLAIGGWASLIFAYFIPNALGAIRLRRQLSGMEQRLQGAGSTLPSQYRVLLDAKFANCRARLRDISMVFAAFATRLAEIQTDAAMYNQWLDIAYGVATVRAEASRILKSGEMPPTVMTLIERKCQEALAPIETGFTKREELQAMQDALNAAQGYVRALRSGASTPELEAEIKDREATVQLNLATLTTAFPTFASFLNQVAANAGKLLSPQDYVDRDTLSLKAALLCEYHDLAIRAGATDFELAMVVGAGPAVAVAPRSTALGRMIERDQQFRDYVQPESYESLRIARLLLEEMKQDLYPATLLAEVTKPQTAFYISADPHPVETRAPTHFSLRFLREVLNEAAATQEWTCYWDFGDNSLREKGWKVYHCFKSPGVYTVTVSLEDLGGNPIVSAQPLTHKIAVAGRAPQRLIPRLTPEAKVEAMQLAITIIALSVLYTAARGKVEGMNGPTAILTLIALGFGAVIAMKNLVPLKPREQRA